MRCRIVGMQSLPVLRIRVVGEPAHLGQRVIDVAAAVIVDQSLIARTGGGDPDLLRAPVEIDADRYRAERP